MRSRLEIEVGHSLRLAVGHGLRSPDRRRCDLQIGCEREIGSRWVMACDRGGSRLEIGGGCARRGRLEVGGVVLAGGGWES